MNRLKEIRKEKNITQLEIANYLKIKQNSYSQYETGKRDLPTLTLKKLANYLNTNLDYIFNLTHVKENYPQSKIVKINNNMNRLKELREDRDLYQKDIAKVINMTQTAYSTYETGLCDIPNRILINLANFYNVSIDYILYMTDERKPFNR